MNADVASQKTIRFLDGMINIGWQEVEGGVVLQAYAVLAGLKPELENLIKEKKVFADHGELQEYVTRVVKQTYLLSLARTKPIPRDHLLVAVEQIDAVMELMSVHDHAATLLCDAARRANIRVLSPQRGFEFDFAIGPEQWVRIGDKQFVSGAAFFECLKAIWPAFDLYAAKFVPRPGREADTLLLVRQDGEWLYDMLYLNSSLVRIVH